MKSGLRVRPVYVYTEDHLRGHVFLEDDDRPAAMAQRKTPVEKARVSPGAERKAEAKRTPDGFPVHSFGTLLDGISSVVLKIVRMPEHPESRLALVTQPTRLHARAFKLLEVKPTRFVPIGMTG